MTAAEVLQTKIALMAEYRQLNPEHPKHADRRAAILVELVACNLKLAEMGALTLPPRARPTNSTAPAA